jgi:hypothetical protein
MVSIRVRKLLGIRKLQDAEASPDVRPALGRGYDRFDARKSRQMLAQ